jgi:predicted dehydrogenase
LYSPLSISGFKNLWLLLRAFENLYLLLTALKKELMTNIAIVGYGYWGPNLVRNFNAIEGCRVKWVSDLRLDRLSALSKLYPDIKTTSDVADLYDDNDLSAIVIATPVHTHFSMAKRALESGKHVLLEKPMTSSAAEAEELIVIAERFNKVLMIDHTFLYTGAIQKIRSLVNEGILGKLQYFDSTRINLGLIQSDVNVLWDLAPHDLSILFHLYPEKPYSVQARGISHTGNGIENIAYLTINYKNDFIAHFNCSWSSPVKLRNILIGGDKKMVLFDDIEPAEKVKIYDKGFEVKNEEDKRDLLVNYRSGDIFLPNIPNTEALFSMALDFIAAVEKGKQPIADSKMGLQVVKVLEAAQQSIKEKGKEVIL